MTENIRASLTTSTGGDVQFLGASIEADLRGLLFEARVEQRFVNKTKKNVEAIYSFPLPWGAALMGVEVNLGGKRLQGAVVEKKMAEARYEESISEGDAAIMLERGEDGSYTLNLGNLNAGEACTIQLQFAQSLQFEQQALRMLIPTVIAPRYGDPVQDGGLAPHQVPVHSLVVDHPFELTLRLHGSLARCRVASPSHPISMQLGEERASPSLTVRLARTASFDRDFVLVVDQLQQSSVAVAAKDFANPHRTAVLASFCPQIQGPEAQSTAIKMLVDCSGSMAGDSIEAAKRALQAIVLQLRPGDKFSLSRFGSSVEHRARGLWKVTETSRLAAQRWVGNLEADLGGTEMAAALMSTFEIAQTSPSDVLLVTDGEISAINQTIAMARRSGHRVFIVGIGSSPAEGHLRRLAAATRGACDFVVPGEAVEPAVLRMFARLRSPQVTDLQLRWSSGTKPEWVTPLASAVFDGDTVNVYSSIAGQPSGSLELLGHMPGNEDPSVLGHVELPAVVEDSTALSRMAAAAQIDAAEARDPGDPQAQQPGNPTQLALSYQLITDNTNFLLLHERADGEKAADMPEQRLVAQMMPAGWGGTGTIAGFSVRRSASQRQQVCYSISDPSANLGVPSTWRRRDVGDRPDKLTANAMDDIEIPAFLRRDPDSPMRLTLFKSNSPHYRGLTPLGLSDRLLIDQPYAWPESYAELDEYLFDPIVVDWLRLVVAANLPPTVTEEDIVRAFLFFMAEQSTYDRLIRGDGLVGAIQAKLRAVLGTVRKKTKKADERDGLIDQDAYSAIKAGLAEMTAEEWPADVLSLELLT